MILKPGFLAASLRILSKGLGFIGQKDAHDRSGGDNGAHAFNETSLSNSILAMGEELVSALPLPPGSSQGIRLKGHI